MFWKKDNIRLAGLIAEKEEIIRQTKLTGTQTSWQEQSLSSISRKIGELSEKLKEQKK